MKPTIPLSLLAAATLCLTAGPSMAQWTPQSSGTSRNLYGVFMTGSDSGTAVGDSGTILHTTNGGATWTAQSSGTTNWLTAVFFTDSRTGTAVGGGYDSMSNRCAIVLRTTNGGETWMTRWKGTALQWFHGVYFTDANTGTVVGLNGAIIRTTDGGATWTSQPSGTGGDLTAVYFSDANTGVAVGSYSTTGHGVIVRTTDGGGTWWNQPLDPAQGVTSFPGLQCVSFSGASSGTAVGSAGTVVHTENGGAVWNYQPSGTSALSYLQSVCFTDTDTGTAVGGGYDSFSNAFAIILRTTNGGKAWTTQPAGTTRFLYGVSFTDVNRGTAVGDHGTILRTTTGGVTWAGVTRGPDGPHEFTVSQNYPNPFNPATTIRYGLPHRTRVALAVFNTLGQQIATLVNESQEAGYHEVKFDASRLASGVYFYRIEAGDFVKTKRLLLLR
jgi:photosystem II stability/assembly factor-like uncharacterized protein